MNYVMHHRTKRCWWLCITRPILRIAFTVAANISTRRLTVPSMNRVASRMLYLRAMSITTSASHDQQPDDISHILWRVPGVVVNFSPHSRKLHCWQHQARQKQTAEEH